MKENVILSTTAVVLVECDPDTGAVVKVVMLPSPVNPTLYDAQGNDDDTVGRALFTASRDTWAPLEALPPSVGELTWIL